MPDKGLRDVATRAGLIRRPTLLFPSSSSRIAAILSAPRLSSFALTSPWQQQQQRQQHKSRWRSSVFSEVSRLASAGAGVQLSGSHSLGSSTVLETFLQGSEAQLAEVRLKIVKTLQSPCEAENRLPCRSANIALSLTTDLQCRCRAMLESMMGTAKNVHTVSCALSSDLVTRPALGLATSHRLCKGFTVFSRFSKDEYAGERFVLQVVHESNARNKLSAIYAATLGHCPQGGVSWTHDVSGKLASSFSLKGLCGGDGTFSISISAQVGLPN